MQVLSCYFANLNLKLFFAVLIDVAVVVALAPQSGVCVPLGILICPNLSSPLPPPLPALFANSC